MSDYFELIETLDDLIDQFESIVTGGESSQVLTKSGYKPSLQKAVSDKLLYLQTLVQGALAYETYSLMIADTSQSPNVLARVWNDPNSNLNGLYGWNGSSWIRSPMDSVADVNNRLDFLPNQSSALALNNLLNDGLESYEGHVLDGLTPIVRDGAGNVVLGVDNYGRIISDINPGSLIKSLSRIQNHFGLQSVDTEGTSSSGLSFAIVDPNKTMGLVLKRNGDLLFKNCPQNFGLTQFNLPVLHHIVIDGQSQANGRGATPELTVDDGRYNWPLMPNDGVYSTSFSSLLPLSESTYETPCSGCALGILDLIAEPSGFFEWKLGVSVPAVDGTGIRLFTKGYSYYSRFLEQVESMKAAATENNLDYQIHGYVWLQGGSDMNGGTSYSQYKSDLVALLNDRRQDMGGLLGAPGLDIHCFTWQNGGRAWVDNIDVPLAQLDASRENANIHLACPSYFFEFVDSVHLTNVSSKWIGMYMGQAYKKVVLDGKSFSPLQPTAVSLSGQAITIDYDVPHPPIEFDTDLLKDVGDQGFIVTDDGGELGVTSISISEGVRIIITVDRPLTNNAKISYGRKYTGSGYAQDGDQCRGHVRDSAGYTNIYRATGDGHFRDLPMHNWSVIFELPIV